MHIQTALYPRSTIETNISSGSPGVGKNTIIFIVLGVVCLLMILIGFYLVSRPRAASNAGPNVSSLHPPHSPITHSPRLRYERDMSEHWKIWRIWRRTNSTNATTADTPTLQPSPPPAAVTRPPRRGASKTYPPIIPRPSHARRVTSLSVATSFSNSHITEEAFSDFRASAYDLDGDLETEMLHSARDDVWVGHPLAVEDSCGDIVEESMEAPGNATPFSDGGVKGDIPMWPTTQLRGSDYENLGACRSTASGSNGVERDAIEEKVGDGTRITITALVC
ncbi:hypothetical protein OG21DRAFT_941409 [Imleria badia]|nr:hypothetical protein OG21DRAFT_941409 [Imleria badia]